MRKILVAALFCASVTSFFAAVADDLALAPREGVLLLKNGELIAGTITAAGDRYDVELKDAEISVRRTDVAAVCSTLEECYTAKRAAIDESRVQDHLDLAEWCLKNGLLATAEKEVAAARNLDSEHPKIPLLERRMALEREQPCDAEPAAAKAPPSQPLDTMVRGLPGGAMPSFTNTVQPLLLNYCAKGGCHASRGAGALHLERIAPNRLTGRNATQRNLAAALALVDREKPAASKLLTAPIRPHGSLKSPVFSGREQTQYRQLVEWVYLVAGVHDPPAEPSLSDRSAPLLQAIKGRAQPPFEQAQPAAGKPVADPNAPPMGLLNADGAAPAAGAANAPPPNYRLTRVHGQLVMRPAPERGDVEDFAPKDPFDPEIFNRRFFGPPSPGKP